MRELDEQYRKWLEEFGDTPQGVGWNKPDQADVRYRVMMELLKDWPTSVLDFGCGVAGLLDHLKRLAMDRGVDYYGLDIAPGAIELCKKKHPDKLFFCGDILEDDLILASCPASYIIVNGLFTYKGTYTFDEMWEFCKKILHKLWPRAGKGLALNFMSKAVEWERLDLFHMPLDTFLSFAVKEMTRHFVVRHDYQLYEYTVYLYK